MEIGINVLVLLFAVALVAGFIDAIAGGGGLITIPAINDWDATSTCIGN